MSVLGNVGSIYMVILIILLIIGLGLIVKGFIEYIFVNKAVDLKKINKITEKGGRIMQTNGWLRLAVFS